MTKKKKFSFLSDIETFNLKNIKMRLINLTAY